MTRIAIAGAGTIGCFVGGLLAAAGHDVVFIGRAHLQKEAETFGLHLTDLDGLSIHVKPDQFRFCTEWGTLSGADIVLVCVKSSATAEVGQEIEKHAPHSSIIISLQNGVNNAITLRHLLSEQGVSAGMVGFNVVQKGQGRFHRGTSGEVLIGSDAQKTAAVLSVAGLAVQATSEIEAVQWGKLVLNLNNAINALSGLPLKTQLETPEWRRILADQISEALVLLKSAGIPAKSINGVPLFLIPLILKLPNPVFGMIARKMLAVDPQARSSMWEDFQAGRHTEIAEFQGQLLVLSRKTGIPAPVAEGIERLVCSVEKDRKGAPDLSASEVKSACKPHTG